MCYVFLLSNKRKSDQQCIKPDKFIVGELGILKSRSSINYSASFYLKMILKEENFERKQVQTQFLDNITTRI